MRSLAPRAHKPTQLLTVHASTAIRFKHVFEFDYSTSSDGIGLGLLIVEQVVDAHGWGIHVKEGAFNGARFEITDGDMNL